MSLQQGVAPQAGHQPPAPPVPPAPPAAVPAGPLDQLIRSQTGLGGSDATSYLRAAAHINPDFRRMVIEELAENPHRIPPPSFGIDLVAVLNECFAARRWEVQRALLMLAVPLAVMPVSVIGALTSLNVILLGRLYLFLAGVADRALERRAARPAGTGPRSELRFARFLVRLLMAVASVALVVGSVVTLVTPSSAPVESSCDFYYTGSCSTAPSAVPPTAALWAVALVVVGWTAVAAFGRYRTLRRLHLLGTDRAAMEPDGHGALYERLRGQQADPDVVYNDYAPFVGAGIEIDHWSFPIELVREEPSGWPDGSAADLWKDGGEARGDREGAATGPEDRPVLTVPAVHARIRRELERLAETGEPGYPGDRLHGLQVIDYVFKNGRRLGPASDWSGTAPGSAFARMAPYAVPEAAARLQPGSGGIPATWWPDSVDLAAEERLRHYLAVRVGSWNEELVVTAFLRVQVQGGLLYLESRVYLLPPIAHAYHVIDDVLPPSGPLVWGSLVLRSLGSSFALASRAVPDLGRAVRSAHRRSAAEEWYRSMCRADRLVDHGPTCSVRELAAEPEYQQMFQEMDVRRFQQMVRTRTLTAVRAVLREHGYRTGAYDRLQNVVIDRSVRVDTLNGNFQTGAGAHAEFQQVQVPPQRVGTQQD